MLKKSLWVVLAIAVVLILASNYNWDRAKATYACLELALDGFRPVDGTRAERFLGKVRDFTARCRGGDRAVQFRDAPWVDWANYWGAGDDASRARTNIEALSKHLGPNDRGVDGALLDLEYQRLELIALNLHDPNTYEDYVKGRGGVEGPVLTRWKEMRLPAGDPGYAAAGGDSEQACTGDLIRHRTVTGICNDIFNPRMGSSGMVFARNVQFEETFPDQLNGKVTCPDRLPEKAGPDIEMERTCLLRNRHGDRIGLLKPDPQVISRKLFTRQQDAAKCNHGLGLEGNPAAAQCDYQAAPFFNVLAAFWIQFMTHDWFGHLDEGRNAAEYMDVGCATQRVGNADVPLTDDEAARLGCRKGDRMQKALLADTGPAGKFSHGKREYLSRPGATTRNHVTAWWDASQIYGYDDRSRKRVKRDPKDRAKLLLPPPQTTSGRPGDGEKQGYLPLLSTCEGAEAAPGCVADPMNPLWRGQEAAAFPDNWTIGMSFYHNVFAREHNAFVSAFRGLAAKSPEADSGLRNPAQPDRVIRNREVTDDELFEAARLVVSAGIAKIHTIEWTTQLLYGEPLFRGMNANWGGLFQNKEEFRIALERIVDNLRKSGQPERANQLYSVLAAGPGIFGLNNGMKKADSIFSFFRKPEPWSLGKPADANRGVNHFGSPFNFPEEFITVYRLHPLVPDLIEYREWNNDPNQVRSKLPVVSMFRAPASQAVHNHGLANMALSMGRQRLGLLTLQNHPAFLQNLPMPHLDTATKRLDIAALDLIRDRERGIPRFNEFRRQYGLQSLTSFDDFVDRRAAAAEQERQRGMVKVLREVYGQHRCDDSKIITRSQLMKGKPLTDCLGHANGTTVDNVEDLDVVVGWLSEFPRPHGFAISETQFVVFILNASRRLFSDRFFTSSFRPEFYTQLGYDWVNNNGPDGKVMEKGAPNGHEMEVAPLKRVLLRTMPELKPELDQVVNTFDPWARDRGKYYSLEWTPRADAKGDKSFAPR